MGTRISIRGYFVLILLCFTATLVSSDAARANSAVAPAPDFEPVFRPSLTIERTAQAIDIDGNLSDAAWTKAAHIDRFVERSPGDMTRPEVRTEVFVTYDDENLYVGFICHDDPEAVRATMCQRDQFSSDDCVIVLIDTYGNASVAYEFFVNPYGIQRDQLWTPTIGEDLGYDMIWRSAAKMTPGGYQVEMAIPFSGLRFPGSDVQQWRMDFWRNRPRESHFQYSWAAYNRSESCWPCQWGTVAGIGSVEPGKGVELLSSIVANQSGALTDVSNDLAFDNDRIDGDLSLSGKYALSSAMTAEATFNPDFSQIEADAARIDVNSTIALFYPERRPFFQEGSDIFRTLFNSFYTRTVNDPRYAAKMTGRTGRAAIGFLTAQDETSPYTIPLEERTIILDAGKSYVNVLRGSLSFAENSRAGFMLTDRRFEHGGYGTILSLDGELRLSRTYSVVGQFVSSFTGEPDEAGKSAGLAGGTFKNGKHTMMFDGESYSGTALISQFRRRGRHLGFTLNFDQVDPSYRTQTGFDPANDYRNAFAYGSYTIYFDKGPFERLTPNGGMNRRWNYDGDVKWTHASFGLESNLRFGQTYAAVNYERGEERWFGHDFEGLWSLRFNTFSRLTEQIALNFNVSGGRGVALFVPAVANELNYDAGITFKPIDRLQIEPGFSFARGTDIETDAELYNQFISRTRLQLQANRELALRFVVQYNDAYETWDVDPLVTYQISPFSVFYVGSTYDYGNLTAGTDQPTDWRLTSRQFFMKLQYLFQT